MIVTYFRSSSYNCWDFCGMQYYLNYCLNLKPGTPTGPLENGSIPTDNGLVIPKTQLKADCGNIVHKALELLARKKVAIQEGEPEFREGEIGKVWTLEEMTPEVAYEEAWRHYAKVRAKHWPWTQKEWKMCRGWFFDVLGYNGGRWNPLNRKVLQPEQYFDITFDEPWARYAFTLPDGSKLDGRLAIKGTVDLVTEEDPRTITYVDWKTGQRKDWNTGEQKDWKKLKNDPQMRLYHYALSKLYPGKFIIVTVMWVKDGGPYSLDFGPEDLPQTERMLRDRFELIKGCERPPRILHDRARNAGQFKCKKMCTFGMSSWDGENSVCDQIHQEIVTLGLSKVTAKYAQPGAFTSYGDGGGVADRDSKKGAA